MNWRDQLRIRLMEGSVPDGPSHILNAEKPKEEEGENNVGITKAIDRGGTAGTKCDQEAPLPPMPYCLAIPQNAPADTHLRERFDGLPLLVLDIETFFDAEYSLTKLPPLHYLTDPRFLMHGIAIRMPDGALSFRRDVQAALAELRLQFGPCFEKVAVVMHNGYFDALALHIAHGIKFANIVDTMLLSRLRYGARTDHDLRAVAERLQLSPKGRIDFMSGVRVPTEDHAEQLAEYACNDAQLTYEVASRLLPYASERPIELWCMDFSIRQLIRHPFPIDTAQLDQGEGMIAAEVNEAVRLSGCTRDQLRRVESFAAVLDQALAPTGRKTPRKPGKTGEIPAVSKKDIEAQILMNDPDSRVRTLMRAHRTVVSASQNESKLEFLRIAAQRRGSVHLQLSYGVAGSGRFQAAGGFNAQNLEKGKRDGSGTANAIRRAIRAPAGCRFVAADASQIEARILAYLAGETELHLSFARGEDVYSTFASAQFQTEVRKPRDGDPSELKEKLGVLRQVGKQAILGLGYGMGVDKFDQTLRTVANLRGLFASGDLDLKKIAAIHTDYRARYPGIKRFWDECEKAFRAALLGVSLNVAGCVFGLEGDTVTITLPSGRQLIYPNARLDPDPPRERTYSDATGNKCTFTPTQPGILYSAGKNVYGGLIAENIVQGVARDLLVHAMYTLERQGYVVVYHCHDSITVSVREEDVAAAEKAMLDAWSNTPAWARGLVLSSETKTGETFNDI